MLSISYSCKLFCPTCGALEEAVVSNEGSESGRDWWPSKNFEKFLATWNLVGDIPTLTTQLCINCRARAHFSSYMTVDSTVELPKLSTVRKKSREATLSSTQPFQNRAELNKCLRYFARHIRSTVKADESFVDKFRITAADVDYGDQFSHLMQIADGIIERTSGADRQYATREIERILGTDPWEAPDDD